MIDSHNMNSLFDADVVDPDGSKIGTVKHVYVDPDGGQPLFVGVSTGWFGTSESFVPLSDADFDGEVLHVEYDKDTVKHAPRIDADGTLSDEDIDRIQDYYDGGGTDDDSNDDEDARRRAEAQVAAEDDALARERGVVDDERPPRKRVRVHRYVVADDQAGTTPLAHDEVTLERGQTDDGTRYETVDESRVERVDDTRGDITDESQDAGRDDLRRRRE